MVDLSTTQAPSTTPPPLAPDSPDSSGKPPDSPVISNARSKSADLSTSPSPKSASPSPPSTSSRDRNGKLDHLPRSRLLKRPCRWEIVGDAHLRYLWRAYRR